MIRSENQVYLKASPDYFLRVPKLFLFLVSSCCVLMGNIVAAGEDECTAYHDGNLRRATIVGSLDNADSNSKISVMFDEGFLFQPSSIDPSENELTAILFELDYLDPYEPIELPASNEMPWNDTLITILVKSTQRVVELDALIRIKGQVPDGKAYSFTHDREGKFTRIEFDDKMASTASGSSFDVFVAKDDQGRVDHVMSCYSPRDVPNPICSVDFVEDRLRVSLDTIRRDELQNIQKIIDTSKKFVRCLMAE